ncbi:Holliday junction recognition protein isoform X2 [Zootoca vivipara]|uniref:Holliday junction recognition protein isoform X2 n=1 Tax=Zootoca vivipara TaxID=8524 RepID=UPI00293BCE4A|nr:Holliday junction recognition protein isoform X2 [Zootoca vivipara]
MESEAADLWRRGAPGGGGGSTAMERRLRRSTLRFNSAMSSVVEKYNLPIYGDVVVSIRSLTYDTPEGSKVWGEEQQRSTKIMDSSQSNVPFQENTEIEGQLASDSENENYEEYQSPNEEQSMVSCRKSLLDTGHISDVESASIKRRLENLHIKDDTSLVYFSGTPAKNKYQVKMDVLLDNSVYFAPKSLTVTRPKAKSVYQWSPLQKLGGESLSGHHDVVLRKQTESINGHTASSSSLQLSNSAAPGSDNMTIVPKNQSLGDGNETVCSSFLEMYESADEHCSWNNVTIVDLYPGMVKALSRLFHKESRKASSNSFIKRYRYAYWHPKKTNLNTSTYRVRKSRQLKQKSCLTITEDNSKGYQLPMANNGQTSPSYDGNHEMQCSMNQVTKVVSSIDRNPDSVEMDASGIVEDHSYTENAGLNGMETTIFPRDLSTEETFLVRTASYIPSLSNFGRKAQTFEDYSSVCTVDIGTTFNLAGDYKTEMSTSTVNATSCLSLSLNRSISSVLQNNKSSPVKTSNRLPGNHEIKTFNKAVSLQRSHSFSSLPVNHSPIKTHQKCDDAFQKMYKELCCSKMRKPFKCSTICTSPRKSSELCKFGFKSLSSNFNQKRKNMIESIYQKLCSEGLPKLPTFMRAANLKNYEGIPMSDTVNALVNSPVRTLPAVARIKRAATFCIEDPQTSPLKRLKNISENSPDRISQKLPYWKNNLQKTDMTFTLHTPNGNNWTSNMDSGFCRSSNRTFLAVPSTCIKESRITSVDENIPMFVENSDSIRKSQNYTSPVSRKLSYHDGRTRRRNAYVEELLCEDYESSFLDD